MIKRSKFLSKILRHSPESVGIVLEEDGWTPVDILTNKTDFTLSELEEIVVNCPKQRFSFNADKTKIRANQGHSAEVELHFPEIVPPKVLWHGTIERNLTDIFIYGLQKMARHHVHLSKDVETATKVGARRGKPVSLQIQSELMRLAGHKFFISDNGVYLTDSVPPQFLSLS